MCSRSYSLDAACTVAGTEEPLQAALRRTVKAEKDSVGSAVVVLEALRMPDASTPVAELCSEGLDTLEAQMLTPPACSHAPGETLHGISRTRVINAGASRAEWPKIPWLPLRTLPRCIA